MAIDLTKSFDLKIRMALGKADQPARLKALEAIAADIDRRSAGLSRRNSFFLEVEEQKPLVIGLLLGPVFAAAAVWGLGGTLESGLTAATLGVFGGGAVGALVSAFYAGSEKAKTATAAVYSARCGKAATALEKAGAAVRTAIAAQAAPTPQPA